MSSVAATWTAATAACVRTSTSRSRRNKLRQDRRAGALPARHIRLQRRFVIAKKATAKPKALKVYRTAIGFHDAYVAAPSKKAALAAWGSSKDLFARGAAEVVTDAALAAEALASPGVVIKRSRGTAAEQIAALPPDRPPSVEPEGAPAAAAPQRAKPAPKPKPKPSRAKLDAAEQAIDDAEAQHAARIEALAKREAELAAERRALVAEQSVALDRLAEARDRQRRAYDAAIDAWRG